MQEIIKEKLTKLDSQRNSYCKAKFACELN